MTIQTKPTTYTKVWAATGSKIAAEDFKISRGWEVEKPPFEIMNWLQNRQDQWIAHTNQRGIAQWDANTEYKANVSYVTGATTGVVYRAVTDSVAVNPETDMTGKWVAAFDASQYAYSKAQSDAITAAERATSNGLYLKVASNFADLSNLATARSNLSVFSKAEVNTLLSNERTTSDGRYLQRSNNLSDLGNLDTARNNLSVYSKLETYQKSEVYSKVESDNAFISKMNNLADVPDKVAARANLGIQEAIDAFFPAGMVIEMAAPLNDPAWVYCDGRALSRAGNPRLFARIGTTYGSVDGNSFKVPDYRGVFRRGLDNGRGIDPGRTLALQQDSTRAHSHVVNLQQLNSAGADSWGKLTTGGNQAEGTIPNINTELEGGPETRPINIPVYVYMKL